MINYDVSKLQVGQTYNYKKLCELTGAKYTNGKSKTLQLESLGETGFRRFFDFEKVAYGKYRIDEIYEEPLPICDERSKGNFRGVSKRVMGNEHFDINDEEIAMRPGVYKIENNQSLYIGSTINRLSRRFSNHYRNQFGTQPKTKEMLQDDGKFSCLESFDIGTDEQTIRDAEAYYIWKNLDDDRLKNKNLPVLLNDVKKIEYNELRIPVDIKDEIMECLKKGGFLVLNNEVYDKRFKEVD